jgi:hypothetical protein
MATSALTVFAAVMMHHSVVNPIRTGSLLILPRFRGSAASKNVAP